MQLYIRIIKDTLDLEYTLPIWEECNVFYEDRRLTVSYEGNMIAAFEYVVCWYKDTK